MNANADTALGTVHPVVKQTVTDLWNKWVGGSSDQNRAVAGTPPPPEQQQQPAQPAGPGSQQAQPAQPVPSGVVGSGRATLGAVPVPVAPPGATGVVGAGVVTISKAPPTAASASPTPVQQLKQARQNLKAQSMFGVKAEGRKHDENLKTAKKTGVPIYDFKQLPKVKSVPMLNVGQEPEISHQNLELPNFNFHIEELKDSKRLDSPAPVSAKDMSAVPPTIGKAPPVKLTAADKSLIEGRVTHEKIERIDYKITESTPIDLKPFEQMSEDDVKMLVTKILFERGDRCPVVLGLADEMSAKNQYRTEALFELGACAKELKLNQAAFDKLSEVIKKQDPEYGKRALATLAKDLPVMYEQPFYEMVKLLEGREQFFSDLKARDEIFYRTAKGAFRAGHYKAAEKWAMRVDPSSSFGPSAQYVVGISQFANKEKPQARATMEKLAQSLQGSSDTVLRGLVSVDLARMDFTGRKSDQALGLYMKIPKDHPLWVSALIEQGWTQLALDDFAGAIGNMYSLHSPYFKVLFQPQSFVVRTIGYLNICQYGDAYRTLTKLESDYRDWDSKLSGYMSNGRTPGMVYDTVKTYLRSKSDTDVEGLPYQIVREAARGKTFLNFQTAINDKSDEMGLFAGVNAKITKEKANVRARAEQAKHRAEGIAAKLAAAKQRTRRPSRSPS